MPAICASSGAALRLALDVRGALGMESTFLWMGNAMGRAVVGRCQMPERLADEMTEKKDPSGVEGEDVTPDGQRREP